MSHRAPTEVEAAVGRYLTPAEEQAGREMLVDQALRDLAARLTALEAKLDALLSGLRARGSL